MSASRELLKSSVTDVEPPCGTSTEQEESTPNRKVILDRLVAEAVKLTGKNLHADQISLIERGLDEILPSKIRIPTHPAYSRMIYIAITELGEEKGSSREAIRTYIRENFDVFPFAHDRFLEYHLEKLLGLDEVVVCSSGRYSIPASMSTRRIGANTRRVSSILFDEKERKQWMDTLHTAGDIGVLKELVTSQANWLEFAKKARVEQSREIEKTRKELEALKETVRQMAGNRTPPVQLADAEKEPLV